MRNREIDARVNRAFSREVPEVLDSILSDCEKQKGNVILMTEKKRMNPWLRRLAATAAAAVILFGGAAGVRAYGIHYAVESTVSLDVNPSVEIKVNQKERVLSVTPRNADGRVVVGDMDFSGSSLDVTVNALIGSMLRNGYLSELANSILISVDNPDRTKGAALQEKLAAEVSALLETDAFSGAVLSQTISSGAELKKLADAYGVTPGKAELIRQIAAASPLYTLEELSALSINELNLLSRSLSNGLSDVASVGTASDKAYIGAERAKTAALAHAGLSAATDVRAELDYENGVMVYEVEFRAGGDEYDYDINALTGAVVRFEKEADDDRPQSGGAAVPDDDDEKDDDKDDDKDETDDRDDGVDAVTSATSRPAAGGTQTGSADYVGEAKAKERALAHAGLAANAVTGWQCRLDDENGVMVYEIEFRAGGYEYDYELDPLTGAVVRSEKELDD